MLIGEYSSPLGEKNRIALPKRLRDTLGEELIITRGYERCLILVDEPRWESLISEIGRYPLLSLSLRDTKRFLLGGAFRVNADKQGRFVIPEGLISYARIELNVTMIGVGEWAEIWDSEVWKLKLDQLANKSADIAERLSQVSAT